MRVAIVHDWLLGMRGGEQCLEVLCEMFPEATLFTLFYNADNISPVITRHRVLSSNLQMLPGVEKYYRHLLPLYPLGMKSLSRQLAKVHRETPFDLVISVSHCAAKNIQVPEGVKHLSYCLTPMRYIWDQYDAYFAGKRLEPVIRKFVRPLRKWDVAAAQRVDHFAGISEFVKARIKRCYGRDSSVVFPPVRTDWIPRSQGAPRTPQFASVSALVPYKNVELIVRAFNELELPLLVVGTGPEEAKLRKIAKRNIQFLGFVPQEDLANLYASSSAMVFAAVEDFGMTPVEIQAAGRPVICPSIGGSRETVVGEGPEATGVYFAEISVSGIVKAVEEFLHRQAEFSVDNCVKQAEKFSLARFQTDFLAAVRNLGIESGEASSALPKKHTANLGST